jgi:hypothetical protein
MVRRGTHLTLAAACAVAISLLLAGGAFASAFSDTFADYKAHGNVNACTHSESDLKQAKSQVPPDISQYAPDFPAALTVALEQRARGVCGAGGTAGLTGTGTGTGTAAAGAVAAGAAAPTGGATPASAAAAGAAASPNATPAPPPVSTAAPDRAIPAAIHAKRAASVADAPAPLLIIAILAALTLLPALAWYVARLRGAEPRWLPDARHALGEFGFRSSAIWSEFSDWVRLGR